MKLKIRLIPKDTKKRNIYLFTFGISYQALINQSPWEIGLLQVDHIKCSMHESKL